MSIQFTLFIINYCYSNVVGLASFQICHGSIMINLWFIWSILLMNQWIDISFFFQKLKTFIFNFLLSNQCHVWQSNPSKAKYLYLRNTSSLIIYYLMYVISCSQVQAEDICSTITQSIWLFICLFILVIHNPFSMLLFLCCPSCGSQS